MQTTVLSQLLFVAGGMVQAETGDSGSAAFSNILLFGVMILIFWFVLLGPQRKEMQQKEAMRNSLKKGDLVITSGGLHGEVAKVEGETVTLKINPKTEAVFEKQAIVRKTSSEETKTEQK